MTRTAELFAIATIILLTFGLLARFFPPTHLVDIRLGRMAYAFSIGTVCFVMAAFLCFFSAVYSLWILPMNQKAAAWHFYLTIIGIGLFWLGLFSFVFTRNQHSGELHGAGLAAALAWLASFPLVAVAQGIFIVNLISGAMKLRTHT